MTQDAKSRRRHRVGEAYENLGGYQGVSRARHDKIMWAHTNVTPGLEMNDKIISPDERVDATDKAHNHEPRQEADGANAACLEDTISPMRINWDQ